MYVHNPKVVSSSLTPQPKYKYLQFQRLCVFFYALKMVAIMLKNSTIMSNWGIIGKYFNFFIPQKTMYISKKHGNL